MIVRYFSIITILLLLGLSSCRSDEGFTDVDGYKYLLGEVGTFPLTIDECSGLANADGQLFVINDGGATEDLHTIDPITMEETQVVLPISNKDWESVIYYNQDLIIADVGNNKGNRGDLFLHHVDVESLEHVHTTTFRYPGQPTSSSTNHNFDCEGMAVIGNQYCLFTKNRGNELTYIYTAPIFTSDFTLRDSIAVPLRVTDVYYDEKESVVLLLCNQRIDGIHLSYLKVVGVDDQLGFTDLVSFPLDIADKVEAITIKDGCTYFIGSEKESGGLGKLYEIELRGL